jgi:hypothetical protein
LRAYLDWEVSKDSLRRRVEPTLLTMKALRPEEEWARDIISRTLSLPVEQHDDGSKDGMHDLWIVDGDTSEAAAEVIAAADSESIKLWKLANSGGRWLVEGLAGGWLVSLVPLSARANGESTNSRLFWPNWRPQVSARSTSSPGMSRSGVGRLALAISESRASPRVAPTSRAAYT